ncbi:hypothetical protein AHAS_Ahas12G0163300 [Arachis hypogaea]
MTAEDSSLDFVSWIRSKLNKNEFLFAAAFWWIWRDRNNDIFHQDDPWSKEKIVHLVQHAAPDFSKVVTNQKHIIPSSLQYNWEPPPMNVSLASLPTPLLSRLGHQPGPIVAARILLTATGSSTRTLIGFAFLQTENLRCRWTPPRRRFLACYILHRRRSPLVKITIHLKIKIIIRILSD